MAIKTNSQNPMPVGIPTGGVTANSFKLIQGILFFFTQAYSAGATGAGYWKDCKVKDAPKENGTGKAWVAGQELYWDATAGKWTVDATGNTIRGFAAADAAAGDTTGDVELHQAAA